MALPAHSVIALSTPLRILTLNTAQLPAPLGMDHHQSRARQVAEVIANMGPAPDIIALQEVFSDMARHTFKNHLESIYPYSYYNDYEQLVGVDSGLLFLSRTPISEHYAVTYSDFRGIEDFAAKGLIGIQTVVLGKEVLVFTTHLQTGGDWPWLALFDLNKPQPDHIKIRQLKEGNDLIEKAVKKAQNPYTFFVGDFNIPAGTDLYANALITLAYASDTHSSECSSSINSIWRDTTAPKRIDYIFAYDMPSKVTGTSCIISDFSSELTDHLAVLGDFDLY